MKFLLNSPSQNHEFALDLKLLLPPIYKPRTSLILIICVLFQCNTYDSILWDFFYDNKQMNMLQYIAGCFLIIAYNCATSLNNP